jgi:hypothetical protein
MMLLRYFTWRMSIAVPCASWSRLRAASGRTPVDGDLLRHAVTADRPGEEAFRSPLVALFGQEEIDRLACLIHGPIEGKPLTLMSVSSMRQLTSTGRLGW